MPKQSRAEIVPIQGQTAFRKDACPLFPFRNKVGQKSCRFKDRQLSEKMPVPFFFFIQAVTRQFPFFSSVRHDDPNRGHGKNNGQGYDQFNKQAFFKILNSLGM
jgi:hypothetical protein